MKTLRRRGDINSLLLNIFTLCTLSPKGLKLDFELKPFIVHCGYSFNFLNVQLTDFSVYMNSATMCIVHLFID